MGIYPAFGLLIFILGGLAYIYLSIYFNTKEYTKKIKKYKKIQLFKLSLENRRKRRGS
jgi:hypothetical protein